MHCCGLPVVSSRKGATSSAYRQTTASCTEAWSCCDGSGMLACTFSYICVRQAVWSRPSSGTHTPCGVVHGCRCRGGYGVTSSLQEDSPCAPGAGGLHRTSRLLP